MAKMGFRTVNEMIGQMDRLDMRKAIDHWKARGLDYSRMLSKPVAVEGDAIFNVDVQDHGLDKALDNELIEKAAPALESGKPVKISNLCTVFAEQEVIAQLAEGAPLKDLVAGIHGALASRIANMAKRLNVRDVIVTGGGAKNKGLVKALSDTLSCAVSVPSEPLLTGAVGAALLGKDIVQKSGKDGSALERKERVLQEVEVL